MNPIYYTSTETPIGHITIIWITYPCKKVLSINLPVEGAEKYTLTQSQQKSAASLLANINYMEKNHPVNFLYKKTCLPGFINLLLSSIEKYFSKQEDILFPLKYTLFDLKTAFTCKVYSALLEIPFGELISYKKLASSAGFMNAYRAVGTVMNKNHYPLLIPCHRVIKENRGIGGFSSGKTLKTSLLKHENSYKLLK
ncbi:MAG: methylated-DNA--[protein]-cysteine S-methyltransferase [Victivallales bacterium]|nr:methylated-DNA--[protein]-cysteine S-methyltransferase [Victivallales bacterium]